MIMGPKQRREREKETLRQEILDAARDLFVKEGYENVSMRRIAEKIEYSPTTIYLYFEDKASLLFAICDETFAKLAKKMETIVKERDDPVEALKRGCRAYVEFGLKNPNHYRVTFINHPQLNLGPDHYLRDGSMGMKAYGFLRAGVEECIKQKRFRDCDLDATTQMIWAGGHGLTSLLITKPDFPWVNKHQLIDLMIDTLIDSLKA
jgi:AcrR family transcriptional regulator